MPHGDRSTRTNAKAERAKRLLSKGTASSAEFDDELALEDPPWEWIRSGAKAPGYQTISGAYLGNFRCMLGDCVLLKAEGSNEAWIGIICEFQEIEEGGEKTANFMWFSSEKEIRNRQRKQMDFLPVSLLHLPGSKRISLRNVIERALHYTFLGYQSISFN